MFDLSALAKDMILVSGSFTATNGTPGTVKGVGFTAGRTSQGLYTVTFANVYYAFVGAFVTYEQATAAARFAQVKSYASSVLSIDLVDASGAVQDGAGRLNFVAVFKRTSA
jgi:hypothetical protein